MGVAMNRDDRKVLWHAVLIALLVTLAAPAFADDLPCPPKLYACWQANLAFEKWGVPRVVAKAKTCGWSSPRIAEALKCRAR